MERIMLMGVASSAIFTAGVVLYARNKHGRDIDYSIILVLILSMVIMLCTAVSRSIAKLSRQIEEQENRLKNYEDEWL
jgi:hypothetical protein